MFADRACRLAASTRRYSVLCTVLVLLAVLAGCAGKEPTEQNNTAQEKRGTASENGINRRPVSLGEANHADSGDLQADPADRVEEKAPPAAGVATAADTSTNVPQTDVKETTIAVLGFSDRGPSVKLAPLRLAITDMLISDLCGYQGLLAVERMRVDQVLDEYELDESALVDRTTAQRVGQALTANYLLSGEFSATPEKLTVTASLYRTGTEEPIAEWQLSAEPAELFKLEEELSRNVLAALEMQNAQRRPPPKPTPGHQPRVAVLALKSHSPSLRLQPMEGGFADILQGSLGALKYIRLVERKELYRVLEEQKLTISQLTDPENALKIGRLLGAERLVYGSFLELENQLRLDVRIVETKTAVILQSQSISGPTEEFDSLLEELAMRLADDLIIVLAENTRRLVESASPARGIEAAIHWANAEHSFLQGRWVESAQHSERALLLEPDNVHAGKGRTRGWFFGQDFSKTIRAASQTLGKQFTPEQMWTRIHLFDWLIRSHWRLGQLEHVIRVARQQLAEYPDHGWVRNTRALLAIAMIRTNRTTEAAEMLEEALRAPNIKDDPDVYVDALKHLYRFHDDFLAWRLNTSQVQRRLLRSDFRKVFHEETKRHAQRSLEMYELIVKEGKGQRRLAWREWAEAGAWAPPRGMFLGADGKTHEQFVSTEKQAELLKESLKSFGWVPQGAIHGHFNLARIQTWNENWEEAQKAYKYVATHAYHEPRQPFPAWEDSYFVSPNNWLERRIEALYWVAHVQHRHQDRTEEATRGFKKLIYDYGVAHWLAPNVIRTLTELDEEIELPEKAVLIWGGGTDHLKAWSKLLRRMDYKVHCVGQYRVSAALLAQYDLVILGRTGMLSYSPTDLLALRSYVATGGSLLCNVSPGWEHAVPSVHNPLLAFFGAHADSELVVEQPTTSIVPHEITEGTEEVIVKTFVHIEAPDEASLMAVGDKTVLAAIPYRHGRVIVTSIGQWLLPDPRFKSKGIWSRYGHWTAENNRGHLPLSSHVHVPMLKKALAWLAERDEDKDALAANRQAFRAALMTALKAQYYIGSPADLRDTMQQLVANMDGDDWKEEALWVAGEISLDEYYSPVQIDGKSGPIHPSYGVARGSKRYAPDERAYEQLIQQFPESPLRPYAEWRLADCRRCNAIMKTFGTSHPQNRREGAADFDHESLAIEYAAVEAPTGSWPWAWSRLRIGAMYFYADDFKSALAEYLAVAEQLENGGERVMAMLGCASCYKMLGQRSEARQYLQAVTVAPEIVWTDNSATNAWVPPHDRDNYRYEGRSHSRARQGLNSF